MPRPVLYATVGAVVIGLLVGVVRGGSIARLAQLPVRLAWLAGLAWLIQVVLFTSPLGASLDRWAAAIHLASIVLVGIVIVANRAMPGVALFGLGLLLNAVVITANGGFMPVSDAALAAVGNDVRSEVLERGERTQKSVLMRPDSPLWVLGDVLPVPPLKKVYSIGDLVAAVGAALMVSQGMGTRSARHPEQRAASRPG
jgi:hypothetical protein